MAARRNPKREDPQPRPLSAEEQLTVLRNDLVYLQGEVAALNAELSDAHRQQNEANERYDSIFELAPVGYIMLNRDGTIRSMNLSIETMLGYPRSYLIGKPFRYLLGVDDRHVFNALLSGIYAGKALRTVGVTVKPRKADPLPVLINGVRVSDDPDSDCMISLTDTTGLKQLQEAFSEALHKATDLDAVFDAMNDCILLFDTGGRLVKANRAAISLLGCDPSGIERGELVMRMSMRRPDGSRMRFVDMPACRALRGEKVSNERFLLIDGGGNELIMQATASPLEEGGVKGAVSIWHDITERERLIAELEASRSELEMKVRERTAALEEANRALTLEIGERSAAEERLLASLEAIHDLYDKAPCGYHSLDKDGLFVSINDTELRWLGYQREELVGKMKLSDLMTPESRGVFEDSFPLLKKRGEINDLEIELIPKDRPAIPVLVNSTTVTDSDGNFVMTRSSVFDITERRKAEKDALHNAHLASIGELAAGVAHEINNPINAIINYAQILVNKGDPQQKEREFANEIIKEGERVATIVNNLLSFARKSKEVKYPVAVKDLLDLTLSLSSAQLRKDGIHLRVMLPDDLPDVMVIPQQIQQVFLNIISNARYALNEKFPEPYVGKAFEIRAESVNLAFRPMVRIVFLDYGTGMTPQVMENAMEPFFTTKPGQQGTGLGLSICNNIISKHGGIFRISSVDREYTEVSVSLPTA